MPAVAVDPLPGTLRRLLVVAAAWSLVLLGRQLCRVVQLAVPLAGCLVPLAVDDAVRLTRHRVR